VYYNEVNNGYPVYVYIKNKKLHKISGGEKMISKDMVIDDILYKYPELEKILKNHGIKCFG